MQGEMYLRVSGYLGSYLEGTCHLRGKCTRGCAVTVLKLRQGYLDFSFRANPTRLVVC